jgi:site-specific DNA-cytosine methylase
VRQIGNAVPVLLAQRMVESAVAALGVEEDSRVLAAA